MVALVIVALAGLGTGTLMRNTMVAQRNLDRVGQVEILRRVVRTQFDCRKSLSIDLTQPLPQRGACTTPASKKTMPILGRDGVELFSMHLSGEFYRIADWHVRATCSNDQVLFEGRLNSRDRQKSKADDVFGEWIDLFSGTSRFCMEYLSDELNDCQGKYSEMVGWDTRGSVCCRVQSRTRRGNAVAQCERHEVMMTGGAMCSDANGSSLNGESRTRRVVKQRIQGPALGNTKSSTTTIAIPGVPHFMFPSGDIISDLIGPWENASVRRGGFLVKSMPNYNSDGTLDRWEAFCKTDDSLDDFTTTAFAVCCPKRW